jgi:hypothetical protein
MSKKNHITRKDADTYELLLPLLQSAYNEVSELSKRKQNENLNTSKVKIVNRILEKIKKLLADEPTAEFLDLLDDSTLPSNSDATLILAQYKSSMEIFYNKYYNEYSQDWTTNAN